MNKTNSASSQMGLSRISAFQRDNNFYREWSIEAACDEGRVGDSIVLSGIAVRELADMPTSYAGRVTHGHFGPDSFNDYVYA